MKAAGRQSLIIAVVTVTFALLLVHYFVSRVNEPILHFGRSNNVRLPGVISRSSIDIAKLGECEEGYQLSEQSIADLESVCLSAPFAKSGLKHVMLTLSSSGHLHFALNSLCSSRAAGVNENFHIFMLADTMSFGIIKALARNAVFLNVSHSTNSTRYKFFCKLKLFVHYRVLKMSVESTICDDDIIFISNPCRLFESDRDIEFATESIVYGLDDHNYVFNIGFMHVIPSVTVIKIYAMWIKATIGQVNQLDQEVLASMIRKFRIIHPTPSFEQSYNVSELLGCTAVLTVRFFHPLDVCHAGHLYLFRKKTAQIARETGYTAPVIVHMSWLGQDKKLRALRRLSLDFVQNGSCGHTPQGVAFRVWNNHV